VVETADSARERSLRSALVEGRWPIILSVAVLSVGVLLRVYFYADRRSLWLDEVWLALNIVGRSLLGLTRPLDFSQSAPVGFLWVERAAVVAGGANELALRAFPLITGCLLLVALWLLARRILGGSGAVLCLTLAALSPLLIYYSSEVKPYISDAFFAVMIMWLALDVLDAAVSRRAWVRLAIGGAVAILFSTPSVFVLAAVGVALVADRRNRTRAGWLRLIATGGVWLLLFVVGYLTVYRSTATSAYMQRIWADSFLSSSPRDFIYVLHNASRSFFNESLFASDEAFVPRKGNTVVALLAVGGAVWLFRRRGLSTALLVVAPVFVVFLASFARRWPLVPRLMVFLVPTLALLVTAGAVGLAGLLPGRVRALALAAVGAFLVIPAARFDVITMKNPRRRDDVAPLIREFHATRATDHGTIMYVLGHAVVPWVYYTARWSDREGPSFKYATTRANTSQHFATRACIDQEPGLRAVFSGMENWEKDSALETEAEWLASQPERDVWVIAISYEQPIIPKFDAHMMRLGATRTLERRRNGASLIRYQFPAASTVAATTCDN
jgi:hypothetical protein